jgi:hypothetical protein
VLCGLDAGVAVACPCRGDALEAGVCALPAAPRDAVALDVVMT